MFDRLEQTLVNSCRIKANEAIFALWKAENVACLKLEEISCFSTRKRKHTSVPPASNVSLTQEIKITNQTSYLRQQLKIQHSLLNRPSRGCFGELSALSTRTEKPRARPALANVALKRPEVWISLKRRSHRRQTARQNGVSFELGIKKPLSWSPPPPPSPVTNAVRRDVFPNRGLVTAAAAGSRA